MKTLVIYYSRIPLNKDRQTIKDSIFCFKEHLPGDIYLVNYLNRQPFFLKYCSFDLIIIHYSFLAIKFSKPELLVEYGEKISKLKGYKIAVPQDEYINSFYLNKFLKNAKVNQLFTCLVDPKDIKNVYPVKDTGISKISTVLTGYVNPKNLKPENKIIATKDRKIDIGYRARDNPFWLGKFSLIKSEIANIFLENKRNNLNLDISIKPEDIIFGTKWFDFIENCKFMIGVESGASVHDPKGKIKAKVESYVNDNPNASFQKVSELFFEDRDGNLNCKAISPRIFEAVSLKTCLILIEGSYNGILKPNYHYIPLKSDFSNIEEIFDLLEDKFNVQEIIDNAYSDIILSKKYNYNSYVNLFLESIEENIETKSKTLITFFPLIKLISIVNRFSEYFILFYRNLTSLRKLILTALYKQHFF